MTRIQTFELILYHIYCPQHQIFTHFRNANLFKCEPSNVKGILIEIHAVSGFYHTLTYLLFKIFNMHYLLTHSIDCNPVWKWYLMSKVLPLKMSLLLWKAQVTTTVFKLSQKWQSASTKIFIASIFSNSSGGVGWTSTSSAEQDTTIWRSWGKFILKFHFKINVKILYFPFHALK